MRGLDPVKFPEDQALGVFRQLEHRALATSTGRRREDGMEFMQIHNLDSTKADRLRTNNSVTLTLGAVATARLAEECGLNSSTEDRVQAITYLLRRSESGAGIR
jgi:hypothetical protein